MITIIICIAITIFTTLTIIESKEDSIRTIDLYLLITVASIFSVVIGAFIGLIVASIIPKDLELKTTKTKIVSMQDNSNISGRFYLRGGRIQEKMVYTMYLEKNDGSFRMFQVDARKATIKYSTNQPTITMYKLVETKNIINKFSYDKDLENKYNYIIEVPKGTIENDYNLDSQ